MCFLLFLLAHQISSQSLAVNSLRRTTPITIDVSKSRGSAFNSLKTWYFVRFHQSPNLEDLQSNGIDITSSSMLNDRWAVLYLDTDERLRTIDALAYLRPVEANEKILSKAQLKKADYLQVEASNDFSERVNYIIEDDMQYYNVRHSLSNLYTITPKINSVLDNNNNNNNFVNKNNLEAIAEKLSRSETVFSITPMNKVIEMNSKLSGYSQQNTKKAVVGNNGSVKVARYLEEKGLTGKGSVVLVDDTWLDYNSTFFYDENYPNFEVNKLYKDHRKIAKLFDPNSFDSTDIMKINEHGTHVAGTAVGSVHNKSLLAMADYNGMASEAKLAFYQSENFGNYNVDEIKNLINETEAMVCTNSWGFRSFTPIQDRLWDILATESKDCLMMFAAGNSGENDYSLIDHYETVLSPGSAKNTFTVGAANAITVNETEEILGNREIYVLNFNTAQVYKLEIKQWSIEGTNYSTNYGLKRIFESGAINLVATKNVSYDKAFQNEYVTIVENSTQFDELSTENPPFVVIIKEDFNVTDYLTKFKRYFPVFYLDANTTDEVYSIYPFAPRIRFYTNYRLDNGSPVSRAPFSSKGISETGIMKPDLVAPGVSIFSARSDPSGELGHEGVTIMEGTSMATPNVAGAAALISQYFKDGKYYKDTSIKPSSCLVRSFLINSADPVQTIYPNPETGYGVLNLGPYIMHDKGDSSHVIVGDRIKITTDSHLYSEVEVTSAATSDLRITISYLDEVLSSDAAAALVIDLDLVVVAPDGKTVYRGNQRLDETEEQFSTNERVIVPKENVTVGKYEIHVFSYIPTIVASQSAEFAITIFGDLKPISKPLIEFQKATKCVPLSPNGKGKCETDSASYRNKCEIDDNVPKYFGHSCQTKVVFFDIVDQRTPMKIPPYGIKYVNMVCPLDAEFIDLTFRIVPATLFKPKFAISLNYSQNSEWIREINADKIEAENDLSEKIINNDSIEPWVPKSCVFAMIYNKSPYEEIYTVTGDLTGYPEPTMPPTVAPFPSGTPLPSESPSETPTNSEITIITTSSSSDNDNKGSSLKTPLAITATLAAVFALTTIVLIVYIILKLRKGMNPNEYKSSFEESSKISSSLI